MKHVELNRTDKEIEKMSLKGLIQYRKKIKPIVFAIKSDEYCECCGEALYDIYPSMYDKETLLSEIDKKVKPYQDLLNRLNVLIKQRHKEALEPIRTSKKFRRKIK